VFVTRLASIALLIPCITSLRAQDLGEAARKQEATKKKAQQARPPARTFTEDDLATYRAGGSLAQSPAGTDAPSRQPSARWEAFPLDEKEWRATAAAHRAAVRKAELQVADVQRALDQINRALMPQYLAPNGYSDMETRRQKAIVDLARAKVILAGAKQAAEDFEEQARRQSIPPGWLREK
jgi:hypothetical protein